MDENMDIDEILKSMQVVIPELPRRFDDLKKLYDVDLPQNVDGKFDEFSRDLVATLASKASGYTNVHELALHFEYDSGWDLKWAAICFGFHDIGRFLELHMADVVEIQQSSSGPPGQIVYLPRSDDEFRHIRSTQQICHKISADKKRRREQEKIARAFHPNNGKEFMEGRLRILDIVNELNGGRIDELVQWQHVQTKYMAKFGVNLAGPELKRFFQRDSALKIITELLPDFFELKTCNEKSGLLFVKMKGTYEDLKSKYIDEPLRIQRESKSAEANGARPGFFKKTQQSFTVKKSNNNSTESQMLPPSSSMNVSSKNQNAVINHQKPETDKTSLRVVLDSLPRFDRPSSSCCSLSSVVSDSNTLVPEAENDNGNLPMQNGGTLQPSLNSRNSRHESLEETLKKCSLTSSSMNNGDSKKTTRKQKQPTHTSRMEDGTYTESELDSDDGAATEIDVRVNHKAKVVSLSSTQPQITCSSYTMVRGSGQNAASKPISSANKNASFCAPGKKQQGGSTSHAPQVESDVLCFSSSEEADSDAVTGVSTQNPAFFVSKKSCINSRHLKSPIFLPENSCRELMAKIKLPKIHACPMCRSAFKPIGDIRFCLECTFDVVGYAELLSKDVDNQQVEAFSVNASQAQEFDNLEKLDKVSANVSIALGTNSVRTENNVLAPLSNHHSLGIVEEQKQTSKVYQQRSGKFSRQTFYPKSQEEGTRDHCSFDQSSSLAFGENGSTTQENGNNSNNGLQVRSTSQMSFLRKSKIVPVMPPPPPPIYNSMHAQSFICQSSSQRSTTAVYDIDQVEELSDDWKEVYEVLQRSEHEQESESNFFQSTNKGAQSIAADNLEKRIPFPTQTHQQDLSIEEILAFGDQNKLRLLEAADDDLWDPPNKDVSQQEAEDDWETAYNDDNCQPAVVTSVDSFQAIFSDDLIDENGSVLNARIRKGPFNRAKLLREFNRHPAGTKGSQTAQKSNPILPTTADSPQRNVKDLLNKNQANRPSKYISNFLLTHQHRITLKNNNNNEATTAKNQQQNSRSSNLPDDDQHFAARPTISFDGGASGNTYSSANSMNKPSAMTKKRGFFD